MAKEEVSVPFFWEGVLQSLLSCSKMEGIQPEGCGLLHTSFQILVTQYLLCISFDWCEALNLQDAHFHIYISVAQKKILGFRTL